MKTAVFTCLCLAVVSAVLKLVGNAMAPDPDRYDPPCGGAKDALIICGSIGAVAFGGAALVLGLAWAVASLMQHR